MVERWSTVWKLCVAEFVHCLQRFDLSLELSLERLLLALPNILQARE